MLGFIIILLVLFILLGVNGLPQNTYRAQWEISTEVVAFDIEGIVTNPPASPLVEPGHWIGPGTWEPPDGWDHLPGVPGRFTVYSFAPSGSVTWDFDQADYGMPDIRGSAGDIRVQEPSSGITNLTLERNGYKYLIDYKEYIFPVQIRTIAGVKIDTSDLRSQTGKTWLTETAMPYEWRNNFGSGGTRVGLPIKGSVFVRVACLPFGFPNFGPAPSGYVFDDYWLGILSIKSQYSDVGSASFDSSGKPLEEVHKGWIRDVPSDGQPLTMWLDDGDLAIPYASVPWSPDRVVDKDIQSSLICEIPFDLKAGAYDTFNAYQPSLGGQIEEVDPVDHYMTVTVRLECFLVKKYATAEPVTPLNPSDIAAPHDWVGNTQLSFWDKYGMWILIGAIIFIIIMIIATWLSIPIWFMMMGRGR